MVQKNIINNYQQPCLKETLFSSYSPLKFLGGNVLGMVQQYNSTRLSLAAVNRMKIKSLIDNCNFAKCFSFHEKRIFHFNAMFWGVILFFNTLCYNTPSYSKVMSLQELLTFLPKFILRIILLLS